MGTGEPVLLIADWMDFASVTCRATVLYEGAAGAVGSLGCVGNPTAGVWEVEINWGTTALAQDTSAMLLKAKAWRCVGLVLRLGVVLCAVFCTRQARLISAMVSS